MRFCIPGLVAALLLPAFASAADPKRAAGTETIPANGFAVLSVNVAQLWDAAGLAGLRKALEDGKNPLMKDFKKDTGLDASEIERVTISAPASPFEREESIPILYITARKALDVPKVAKALGAVPVAEYRKTKPVPEEVDGKSVYVVDGKKVVVFVDDRTVAFLETWNGFKGVAKFLDALKDAKPAQDGPLAAALALAPKQTMVAAIDIAPVRKALEGFGEVPEEFKPFTVLVQAESGVLTFDFGTTLSATAKLTFFDAETAKKAEPAAKAMFEFARKALTKANKEEAKRRDPETKAILDPIIGFIDAALGKGETKLDGKVLTATTGGEIDAALKKSLAAFPEWAAVTTERMKTTNNLKQIGLAMHNFESANGAFPQDILDKDGKAILSWRVHLLPYLEQDNLYKKLDLTKPWDDAANKEFLEQMPDVFKVAGREPKEKGFTYFQSFTAEKELEGGSPFLMKGAKRTFVNITDGTSNTLMVVDGATAVNWMKPGDLTFDPKKLPKVGKDGWIFAGFADGHVRRMRIPKDDVLRALITINGGEVVNIDDE